MSPRNGKDTQYIDHSPSTRSLSALLGPKQVMSTSRSASASRQPETWLTPPTAACIHPFRCNARYFPLCSSHPGSLSGNLVSISVKSIWHLTSGSHSRSPTYTVYCTCSRVLSHPATPARGTKITRQPRPSVAPPLPPEKTSFPRPETRPSPETPNRPFEVSLSGPG